MTEVRRTRKVPPSPKPWVQARVDGRFRVSAEWICDTFESAEELADLLVREDHAETSGVTPLAENRCGCCGNPLADEPVIPDGLVSDEDAQRFADSVRKYEGP